MAVVLALIGFAAACDRTEPETPATGGLTILNPAGDRPTFFDFDRVPYGAKLEHVFRLRNDDPEPVTIRDVIASCSCTVPRISYEAADGTRVVGTSGGQGPVITLPAGAIAELAVRVDTEHVQVMNMDKLAQVRIRCDSKTTPYLTLELHLVVERAMRAVPAVIELGPTPQSVGKSGRADVSTEVASSRARVTGVASVEGPFTATVDETVIAGTPVWIVVATANPGLPIGPVSGKVVLSLTGEDGTGSGLPFTVPVTAQIAPEVVLRPPVFLFGTIERGKETRLEAELLALAPGDRVKVTGWEVRATPEGVQKGLTAEATPVDPVDDGSATKWKIVIQTRTDLAAEEFSGTLVLWLDHPKVKEIRAPFSGVAK